jgi:hypothetical protein
VIAYFAPGAGIGHLNRALAVCLELRETGIAAEIVTNSPFAAGVAAAARFPIVRVANWERDVRRYVDERAPGALVLDSFPAGIHNEWAELPCGIPAAYVARRMKDPPPRVPRFARIIVAEPLSPAHDAAIAASGSDLVRLPGPIRLRPETVRTKVPDALQRVIDEGRPLVIHSGPEAEVRQLLRPHAAIITPRLIDAPTPSFDYFPAGNLVASAAHVASGAGYNMMADMMFARDRHTAVAFDRRFDDQAARLACPFQAVQDGTREAAVALAPLVPYRR